MEQSTAGLSAADWAALEALGWPRYGPEPEPPAVTPILPAAEQAAAALIDLGDAV